MSALSKNVLPGGGLPSSALRNIAVISMMIDHIGMVLYSPYLVETEVANWYSDPLFCTLSTIGRLAFPLFAYMIAEGAFYTHDRKKYALKLFVLSMVSIVPYHLAFNRTYFSWKSQNVFFGLLLGLLAIMVIEWIDKKCAGKPATKTRAPKTFFKVWVLAMICAVAQVMKTDFGLMGVLLILAFYFFRDDRKKQFTWAIVAFVAGFYLYSLFFFTKYIGGYESLAKYSQFILNYQTREIAGLLSFIIIAIYNEEKGKSLPRGFYYWFYPVHLLVLWGIASLIY